jgi:hypothetical protein
MNRPFRPRFNVLQLEERTVPATWNATLANGSLTITQVTPLGAADTLNVTDSASSIVLQDVGANTTPIPAAGIANVTLNLLLDSGAGRTVNYDLTSQRTGNLTLNMSSGNQTLNVNGMTGTAGVGGNMSIYTVNGNDNFNLAVAHDFSIGGSLTVNSGTGTDSLVLGSAFVPSVVTVGGNLIDTGTNNFTLDAGSSIGGLLSINSYSKNSMFGAYNFFANQGTPSVVGGSVNITTGNGGVFNNVFQFQGIIGGGMTLNLGNSLNDQVITTVTSVFGGNFSVIGGSFGTTIDIDGALIGGSVNLNLSKSTQLNSVTIRNNVTIGGSAVTITGGAGTDVVDYAGHAAKAALSSYLGAGDDQFILEAGSQVASLYIDFGAGNDTFTNNFGAPFYFSARFVNL